IGTEESVTTEKNSALNRDISRRNKNAANQKKPNSGKRKRQVIFKLERNRAIPGMQSVEQILMYFGLLTQFPKPSDILKHHCIFLAANMNGLLYRLDRHGQWL